MTASMGQSANGSQGVIWFYSQSQGVRQMMTTTETIESKAAELGITMTAEFIPFSRSRNKQEKVKSLNWVVTLSKSGKPFLTTDYGAGCGHCPSYKQGDNTYDRRQMTDYECEHGKVARHIHNIDTVMGGKLILPKFADVLSSLALDATVLDHSSFESWAAEFGYDVDSRKAEGIYRACLDTALKLRNAIGEDGLRQLQEACQDH